MWSYKKTEVNSKVEKYELIQNGKIISYEKTIDYLKNSVDFVRFFTDLLKESSFEGFFWEVKLVTIDKIDKDFEFVIVQSSMLPKTKADDSAFKSYFKKDLLVVTFPNLGGDAQLIAPVNIENYDCYGHLADFVRKAPEEQIISFWQVVGQEYEKLIGNQPRWLSTAGLGVYWLHIRIDSRPKYYRYRPYKHF